VYAATGLVFAKLIVGYLTGSLAVYSEAGHSGVDLIAAVISYVAVRNAGRPPDEDHLFGHAKFESIGALFELMFLGALGAAIVYSALRRLVFGGPEITITGTALALVVVTIAVDFWRTVSLHTAAKRTGSEALAASALHFLSDLCGTLVMAVSLGLTYLGFHRADSLAALVIAVMIFYMTFRLGQRVFHSLTDRAPKGIVEDVQTIVLAVEDVKDVHDIRVRQAGSQYFTEMHVSLSPELSLERAHHVLDRIESVLRRKFPSMHVVTHPEPAEETAETLKH
jgi:cation diffusion facilitator family transporter